FALKAGEILALLGENGAGKSTLIKIFAGVYTADGGSVLYHGEPYRHKAPKSGEVQRVAFIHQDLGLLEWMTVAENIAMSVGFPRRGGNIHWDRAEELARRALDKIGAEIDPMRRVQHLTRTEKSLVAIARALAVDPTCWCSTNRRRACRPTTSSACSPRSSGCATRGSA